MSTAVTVTETCSYVDSDAVCVCRLAVAAVCVDSIAAYDSTHTAAYDVPMYMAVRVKI
jgi:hypothetical protein